MSVYYKYPVPEIKIGSSLFKWNYLPKQNLFLSFLFHLWNIQQILNIFKKKKIVIANYFRNYRVSKTCLDHSLISPVSEHPSTINMLKCPKQLWNLHDTTFIIFFYHSEAKLFRKYILYGNLRSEGCLLTHWLAMTSILLRIVRTCGSRFKSNFLKNKNIFLHFLFHLWNAQ